MSETLVDKIARAVLYEGYILYPYRPCVKSRQRWTFGGIFPRTYSESHGETDPCVMQMQCLLHGSALDEVALTLRFLHLMDRVVEQGPAFTRVESLRVGAADYYSWQEAIEREVRMEHLSIATLSGQRQSRSFSFPDAHTTELLQNDDHIEGRLVREQQAIDGIMEISAQELSGDLVRLTVRIVNTTTIDPNHDRDTALLRSFASSNMVVHAPRMAFVSLTDPPAALLEAAGTCHNIGCWPVLVGDPQQTDTLLASPIILPDYPQIAPESPGDLFDGCEIDEILSLRIRTLTDAEKQQAASVDDRVRQMLERTDGLARDQLMNLHGAVRNLQPIQKERQHA